MKKFDLAITKIDLAKVKIPKILVEKGENKIQYNLNEKLNLGELYLSSAYECACAFFKRGYYGDNYIIPIVDLVSKAITEYCAQKIEEIVANEAEKEQRIFDNGTASLNQKVELLNDIFTNAKFCEKASINLNEHKTVMSQFKKIAQIFDELKTLIKEKIINEPSKKLCYTYNQNNVKKAIVIIGAIYHCLDIETEAWNKAVR